MEVKIHYRLIRLVIFFIFGIPILLLNLCADSIMFIIHCYQSNLSHRQEQSTTHEISKDTFKKLFNIIDKEIDNQIKTIDPKALTLEIRDKMNVSSALQLLIFGYTSGYVEFSTDMAIEKIDEYVLIKKIISKLTLPTGIFVENLKHILKELKLTSKVKALISTEDSMLSLSTKIISIEHDSHLKKLHYVDLNLLYQAFESISEKKLDLLGIK